MTFNVDLKNYFAPQHDSRLWEGKKLALVASRFNSAIVDLLVRSAVTTLQRAGFKNEQLHLFEVPGAMEIVYCTSRLLDQDYQGVICLGCVIRGETSHYEMVSNYVCNGIAKLNLQGKIPVVMGVLTTENVEQAQNRAGLKHGNTGEAAAFCALDMLALSSNFK